MDKIQTPEELKPCPFCGGCADLCDADDLYNDHEYGLQAYRIICQDCYIEISDFGDDFDSAQEAIKAWNSRDAALEAAKGE